MSDLALGTIYVIVSMLNPNIFLWMDYFFGIFGGGRGGGGGGQKKKKKN